MFETIVIGSHNQIRNTHYFLDLRECYASENIKKNIYEFDVGCKLFSKMNCGVSPRSSCSPCKAMTILILY